MKDMSNFMVHGKVSPGWMCLVVLGFGKVWHHVLVVGMTDDRTSLSVTVVVVDAVGGGECTRRR